MGAHAPTLQMLINNRPIEEIPFAMTIREIESARAEIDHLREKDRVDVDDFEGSLLALEDKLRSAYSKLAADAANKVANWAPGPKIK